ncbi:MAG: DUF5011 domain-containing protein [Erysipelotrichaceae bacterium]|nr:DUF5011 domain-containing protein [Erysipelotrichaceae bacterium]
MDLRNKKEILENLQERVVKRKAMFIPLLFVSTFGLVGYVAMDKEAPTIDANKIEVLYGTNLDETMFDIEDNRDSLDDIEVTIDDSTFDADQLGTYNVEVTAADSFSNTYTKTIEVEVVDKTAPVLSSTGDGYAIEVDVDGSEDITNYITATDNVDGDVTTFIETDKDLDTSKLGTQTIAVSVSDNSGNTTTQTYEFSITDTQAPVITLTDGETVTVDYGSSFDYTDYVSVKDNYDKDVDVSVDGSINTKSDETQTLTITATDSSNNTTTETLKVKVEDLTAPTITLSKTKVTITAGNSFSAKKYLSSAKDTKDGDLTDEVDIDSNVKTSKAGTYTVTYSVSDKAGNKTSKTLTVTVKKKATSSSSSRSSSSSSSSGSLSSSSYSSVVAAAKSRLGCSYRWGASGPSTFDCSGLTMWCYAQVGKSIPHSSSAQKAAGTVISLSQLKAGDIVWRSGHVGIYVGNGLVIHAPGTGKVVCYTSVSGFTCGVRF